MPATSAVTFASTTAAPRVAQGRQPKPTVRIIREAKVTEVPALKDSVQ